MINSQQKQKALDIVTGTIKELMKDGDHSFTIWFEIKDDGGLELTIDSLSKQVTVDVGKEKQ